MFQKKKILKIFLISTGAIVLLGVLSFLPTFSLERSGMKTMSGTSVTVYYEKEEAAARDVFELAEAESVRLAQKLGFTEPPPVCFYIYDKQSTFQMKKYGFITLLFGLDWYIGDNRGTNVLLTSPANPGKVHSYEDIKTTSLHEMVHAYNSLLNPNMPLWVNEGVALYLTSDKESLPLYQRGMIPSLAQTRTANPITFSNIGGYVFARTYIEFLNLTYGWEKVLSFLKTVDYMSVFGGSEQEIYDEWINFLKVWY